MRDGETGTLRTMDELLSPAANPDPDLPQILISTEAKMFQNIASAGTPPAARGWGGGTQIVHGVVV